MKFGHEYEQELANADFEQWRDSAIDYKFLKKCIKKVHRELTDLGLDANAVIHLSEHLGAPNGNDRAVEDKGQASEQHEFHTAERPRLDAIAEEFTPQLRVLVDSKTASPLDATLTPETKESLRKMVQQEMLAAQRQPHLGHHATHEVREPVHHEASPERAGSPAQDTREAKWIQLPLASAKDFFNLLAPKLDGLERIRKAETRKLEDEVLDLGDAVENVIQPVREGFEAKRAVSYRDLYFWREMFRIYLETPIFYSSTEQNRGALTYHEAETRLRAFDQQLKETGLHKKMRTPQAKQAANMFFQLNLDILNVMHFQEINAVAMRKIMKKFKKQTHLEGKPFLQDLTKKYAALLPPSSASGAGGAGGFANSIARDLYAEISTKVLTIVPQLDDWNCPVCLSMAWRPVNLRCCRSLFCIRCVIKMQDDGITRCPTCNAESVRQADGRNINFEAMDFLEKYFPLETKQRQKENERANLERQFGEEFTKPGCSVM